ncbi:MAG: hypothetical protein ACFFKA_15290, partial [Candidatus Thorarchaeota archaeon]
SAPVAKPKLTNDIMLKMEKAIADGKEIPQEALDLFSKRFIPNFFYNAIVNLGWRLQGRKQRQNKIKYKPYSL